MRREWRIYGNSDSLLQLRKQVGLGSCCQQEQAASLFMRARGNGNARFRLFFSRDWHAGQATGSSHTIQLADADAHPEPLLEQVLHSGTGNAGMGLAILAHQGKHFSTQFDGATVPSLGQRLFSFALHALEQAIDCGPMHEHAALRPRFADFDPLLHLPDNLLFRLLAKLWGDGSSSRVWSCQQ
jgi:hypothetical protein